MESSTRILILGTDASGKVVQSDRNATAVLETELGTPLDDVVPGAHEQLRAALHTGRERTVMLTLETPGGTHDAVVTLHPMCGGPDGPGVAALAVIKIPVPLADRFMDPAVVRRALLDDALPRIGSTLDLDMLARSLMDVVVPHLCNSGALLLLESALDPDDEAPLNGQPPLRRMAVGTDDGDPAWDAAFPTGETVVYPKDSPYSRCLESGRPLLVEMSAAEAAELAVAWRRPPVEALLGDVSMLMLPVLCEGQVLGLFVCLRTRTHRPFDAYDLDIGMDFANRSAIFIESARRYGRERATALTLQRSLLPTGLSAPSSVEVRHRYLPGGRMIEVGGDWYEAIALPGARVALVVGDVAGHGVRAAVTMGRLRTAIHTLAGLDLPPAEALERLDSLMRTLGEREPHFATCAYVVYDAVTGRCEVASAGHLPPLLVPPEGACSYLDVPPAPPLGVGGGEPVVAREFTVADGTLLFLYTDGLVEHRARDIDDGLDRLRGVFDRGTATSLDDLCRATLDGVYDDHKRDDIALLLARLHRIPATDHVAFTLPAEPAAARRARGLVRERLDRWDLNAHSDTAALLASELVTNALRHSTGRVTLRLVREAGLVCEVFDSGDGHPRVVTDAEPFAETGRGLHVVARLAHRWGTRRTRSGKAVWFELAVL
ncbi:ATP-binding SpoIIE family protein phosphatase [Actinomadura flavalba]|uniref:ATP-binding SpoIIE family protein phosphatase n=1 Tax=Actinomadura flavalba TaxID=1120938 RepID=UPI0003656301|nr:SpoIIE family protein phosphatase [Actinomadura flavalba]